MVKDTAQQSVHLTGGILPHFRALSSPEQNPALEVLSTLAPPQVTQAVGRLSLQGTDSPFTLGAFPPETAGAPPSVRRFSRNHQYKDNRPTLTIFAINPQVFSLFSSFHITSVQI